MKTRLAQQLTIILLLFSSFAAFAQPEIEMQINHFMIKENLIKNNKLAIIATDSLEKPLEKINGTFQFSINGFNNPLIFHDGVAIAPNKIENSTFVYLQHKNQSGTHSALFYVLKKDDGLQIYKIGWFILLLIPTILIIFVMLFKRFLWIGIILIGVYLYYNSQKGLGVSSFFEIIIEGFKNLV